MLLRSTKYIFIRMVGELDLIGTTYKLLAITRGFARVYVVYSRIYTYIAKNFVHYSFPICLPIDFLLSNIWPAYLLMKLFP